MCLPPFVQHCGRKFCVLLTYCSLFTVGTEFLWIQIWQRLFLNICFVVLLLEDMFLYMSCNVTECHGNHGKAGVRFCV